MNRNNIIKNIEERDLEQLERILKQAFDSKVSDEKTKNFYNSIKDNKDIYILGYYLNDTLVGTVSLYILTMPYGKEATIWNVAVDENYRRLGIATKLMIKAEEIVKSYKDVHRIWLSSGYQREKAHKLYLKLGYDEERDKAFIKQIS